MGRLLKKDEGFVNVGTSRDTAEFAVASIRNWWQMVGSAKYPYADRLLILADCGGSNGYRTRLWKHRQSLLPIASTSLSRSAIILEERRNGIRTSIECFRLSAITGRPSFDRL